ncbi:MAG: PAS domain S-box protein [Methylococcaceae bacterium]|nr:PAS domain S-box protein [Methylococcaceae bacterium]
MAKPLYASMDNKLSLRRRSLIRDLKYSLVFGVAAVSILTAFLVFDFFLKQSEREYQANLIDYTDYLSKTLEPPLWDMEDELVGTICKAFAAHENIAVLRVFNDERKALCDIHSDKTARELTQPIVIHHQGRIVGEFELGLDDAFYRKRNIELLAYSLAITLVVVAAVALLLQLILKRLLQKPLGDLIEHIEKFAAETHQISIEPGERKEFAFILYKFNEMAAQVAAREQALRDSEQRFRALFEQAAVGVAQVETTTGRFVRINRRYCEIAGYSQEEMRGVTSQDITYPADRQVTRDHMASLVAGSSREFTLEKRYRRKDGSIVWVNLTVSPMWEQGERPNYHVSVVQDITARVQAQEELLRLNLNLEQRVQQETLKNREKDHMLIQQSRLAAMGEMVHNIAHQWRQPLNALAIIINNIQDDYEFGELSAATLQEAVAKSRRLLERMSTTVDDFRDFFRPDKEASDFAVERAVQDAVFIIGDSLKNNHIELDEKLDSGLIGHGYPNQFSQAILNLLVNAKEEILQRKIVGGRIEIRLHPQDDEAVLSVGDNAGGIEEGVLPKIFDPYFTTKEQGSGIGLYMTKMILERNMKGRICASNGSYGALFTIFIPLSSHRSN